MLKTLYTAFILAAITFTHFVEGTPFVSGNLVGQLGNQMFQIAAAVSLALDNGAEAVFPDLVEKTEFNIPENHKNVFFRLKTEVPKGTEWHMYLDPNCHYTPIPFRPNIKVGWWLQSEKYFIHHKQEILDLFAPSEEIVSYLEENYSQYYQHPCSVGVQVRSYLREDPYQKCHNTLPKQYYEEAIYLFPEDALFIVCSNDIKWCKENFADIPRQFVFIDDVPHHDVYLLSMCKHNIISNSSFSWWGAYLNKHLEKSVVAPEKWFSETSGNDYRDVVPNGWIKI